jgi:superfamily II DNA or RNA helicase
VCLVAPTGSGKTVMAVAVIEKHTGPVLVVVHRRELAQQMASALRAVLGHDAVGVIMAGVRQSAKQREARVQVASVQTLLARGESPPASLLVLDECHHYRAEEWQRMLATYPDARVLGMTATPERADGKPLGDVFEKLVVAAQYSELVTAGHLVPARVHTSPVTGRNLAQSPIDAWARHGEGKRAFLFAPDVRHAETWAKEFRRRGMPAEVITHKTPKATRDAALRRFERGDTRILCNVHTLTEGVDVPEAGVIILARTFDHVSGFLQAVGRGLRPAPSKDECILLDLTGATARHGLPHDDREYGLEGRAISEGSGGADVERERGERTDPEVLGLALTVACWGARRPGYSAEVVTLDGGPLGEAADGRPDKCRDCGAGISQGPRGVRLRCQTCVREADVKAKRDEGRRLRADPAYREAKREAQRRLRADPARREARREENRRAYLRLRARKRAAALATPEAAE